MTNDLYPKLIVGDAGQAIGFYTKAFGATEMARIADDAGKVVHAELDLEGRVIALAQAVYEWGGTRPRPSVGHRCSSQSHLRTPIRWHSAWCSTGPTLSSPSRTDRPYGKREGRLKDPCGHLWIISGESR